MFKRAIEEKLLNLLKISPVVLINGARQTGKTTLVKQIAREKKYTYVTLDDAYSFALAKSNPQGFIEGLTKPVIIDEVQRAPEIFMAIKKDIDEHRHYGRYILTGSANPLLIPRLGDSLAGRMMILDLYPLSQGEMQNKKELFIDWAFGGETFSTSFKSLRKEDIYKIITAGGYPEIQTFSAQQQALWFQAYITTILYRDVQDLAEVEKLTEFPKLLRLLATRVANVLNISELSVSSAISPTTLRRYLALLEILFILKLQPAWSSNLSSRLIKSPKSYLVDSGLLCFLLGIDLERALSAQDIMGPIVENFVVDELFKQSTWNQARVSFYHFRTNTGVEVDIVLEDAAGNIVGIEVKNSSSVTTQDFKGLHYLQELVGNKFARGILLYTGSEQRPYNQKICALPITALWNNE